MLEINEISTFIDNDESSAAKREARKGRRYYDAEHDIKDYRIFYYNADGQLREEANKSNVKISHPFFTELVDQQVQYMLSGEKFLYSDNEQLQKLLEDYFDDDFIAELQETLTGTVTKGFDYMYGYVSGEGKLRFQYADSLDVIEVSERDAKDGKKHVIYHYVEQFINDDEPTRRIQVWDESEVWHYKQVGDGKIELDDEVKLNPAPHVLKTDEKGEQLGGKLGYIPFFRLDNNRRRTSGLKAIKPLIDDYDLMNCGLSNNIQDANEYVAVVSGFQGDDLSQLMENIKTKKHIGVNEGGGLDYKTVAIPYEARKVKMEADEKNIYRFGMGFNSAQVGDGNITNIVIKSRYALLDLKCNKLEIRLKQFLKKLIRAVIDDINKESHADYQPKDVKIEFTREVMTNALDNAQIELTNAQTQGQLINNILSVANTLDDETTVKTLCEILDLDYDEVKERLPDNELDVKSTLDALNALEGGERIEQATEGSPGTSAE